MSDATIKIRRTDGSYDSFVVKPSSRTTVLDALEKLRTEQDHSLMYRHSCHHGSCGTCGMIVNGERKLACITHVNEAVDDSGEVQLDPLSPFEVVGDLAVNPESLYADFPADSTYLRESEANPEAKPPEEIEGFTRFENCVECGICVSVCPVTQAFKGPAALAAYNRELEKRPERAKELLPEVAGPDGVYGCDRALNCSQACPLGVYPAKHIALLKRKVEQEGLGEEAE
ncbi:MAG: succinate dehydrogenase/fumarate reductase iron-sulfur subunit [Spirochaetales bacterium]